MMGKNQAILHHPNLSTRLKFHINNTPCWVCHTMSHPFLYLRHGSATLRHGLQSATRAREAWVSSMSSAKLSLVSEQAEALPDTPEGPETA